MEYKNKDLIQSQEDFEKSVTNDIIGNDFIEQLEWGMMMIKNNFKQIRHADYLPPITANTFDKAYLMSSSLNDNIKFLKPFGKDQVNPDIIPLINIKTLIISDTISLSKIKELDLISKRNLKVKSKHAYEYSYAFYKNDTQSFYGQKEGYEVCPDFFNLFKTEKLKINALPKLISLNPKYNALDNAFLQQDKDIILTTIKHLSMAYQIAMSMYYEWSIYIKEKNTIGFTIPIEPIMLKELFKTSILKFDDKKRMLHFVKDHYRRKKADVTEDYSVYVKKYLRGETKFDYRGFYAEIVPPQYDLKRIKTRKNFINTITNI